MATLFQRPNSPYWWLYSVVKGAPKFRGSTGIRHDGKKKPNDAARAILAHFEEKQARQQWGMAPLVETKPLAEFANDFALVMGDKSEGTQRQYGIKVGQLVEWCAANQVVTVSDLHAKNASEFLDHLRSTVSQNTVRQYAFLLATFMEEAKRRNLCAFDVNPFKVKIKKTKKDKVAFTPEQITKLLASDLVAPGWLKVMNHVAAYTGARSDTIVNLRWEHIGFDLGFITFVKSKTGKYAVPLHPDLKAYLEPLRQAEGFVAAGPQDKAASYVSVCFTTCMEKNKLGDGNFHMWRHTYVTRLERSGVDKRISMKLANHSSESVHDAYAHTEACEWAPELSKLSYKITGNGVG